MATELEEHYETLKELVGDLGEDVEKFAEKGNKSAGTRARIGLQKIKQVAQAMRGSISEMKHFQDSKKEN
jgi:hypothetical protein